MNIIWEIEPEDIRRVKAFFAEHKSSPFVKQRIQHNLRPDKPRVRKDVFWRRMVACLLTTQQKSGPSSAVAKFIRTRPFSLAYSACASKRDLHTFAHKVLTQFGGLRRTTRIADEIQTNMDRLNSGLWKDLMPMLDRLRTKPTVKVNCEAADFIDDNLSGFGPKQSRNLLQSLGLSKHEIPIDSRITKWLNDFGFPVKLSADALSDRNYYRFVSEGFRELCKASGVMPCVMDAAIFSSYDKGGWTEQNIVW